jgi:glutamate/tyrosine decarboxylase-like PLP-dependent enzyme
MNIGAAGGLSYHSANYVEYQVLDWLKRLMRFPREASGLLTSGCSAANLIGLATARNTMAGGSVREEGLAGGQSRMVLYASEEAHSSIQKAVELLGLGSTALRKIPVNRSFQIRLETLRDTIAMDRREGLSPFCVVGAAGTTNTGAIDDLRALAGICRSEELWLHVDGAFGAWAILTEEGRGLLEGMEEADSLAFDLHKWMYMPYEIGCVLVRDREAHRQAFSLTPAYLTHGKGERGLTGDDLPWLDDYGFQLSRGFRALKAWMSLKEHGVRRYARLIQQNIEQARHLGDLVEAAPELELVAPVFLNVVCFRFINPDLEAEALDELNDRIIVELQEEGIAVVSGTTVLGKRVLHVAHTNHRSTREDFEVLVREVVRLGVGMA